MEKNNAKMYDVNTLIAAGIDPKTGLPPKANNPLNPNIKSEIKKVLRIKDEATAINRFTWYNLPKGINAKDLERVLYYKGQGILFFVKEFEQFYFLPYALDGSIDIYGRFMSVRPLPFNGVADIKKEDLDNASPMVKYITALSFKPVYDPYNPEEYIDVDVEKIKNIVEGSCVILKDFSEQMSQTNISRQILNDPILDVMSNYIPYMNTALSNSTGVLGMRVGNENEQSNVMAASNAVNKAALEGNKYVPIIGSLDFQEMTGGTVAKAEEYLLAMQGLDNFRLSLYGLENGGLFQKKAHILQDEQNMNTGMTDLIMRDSLEYRQYFCDICNSIWGLDMWCEQTQTAIMENNDTPYMNYDEGEEKEDGVETTNEGGSDE